MSSLQEEIRKHAEQYILKMRENPTLTPIEKGIMTQWIVRFVDDVVLGVVGKLEAEHQKHFEAIREEYRKAYEGTVAHDQAEQNQKLTDLFDTTELQRDIRSEEEHQEANPTIDPTASNWAIQHTKGRIYERQFLKKKIEVILGKKSSGLVIESIKKDSKALERTRNSLSALLGEFLTPKTETGKPWRCDCGEWNNDFEKRCSECGKKKGRSEAKPQ